MSESWNEEEKVWIPKIEDEFLRNHILLYFQENFQIIFHVTH